MNETYVTIVKGLRNRVEALPPRSRVNLALFCANQMAHLESSDQDKACREVAEKYVSGGFASAEQAYDASREAYGANNESTVAAFAAGAIPLPWKTPMLAPHTRVAVDLACARLPEMEEEMLLYLTELESLDEVFEKEILNEN